MLRPITKFWLRLSHKQMAPPYQTKQAWGTLWSHRGRCVITSRKGWGVKFSLNQGTKTVTGKLSSSQNQIWSSFGLRKAEAQPPKRKGMEEPKLKWGCLQEVSEGLVRDADRQVEEAEEKAGSKETNLISRVQPSEEGQKEKLAESA